MTGHNIQLNYFKDRGIKKTPIRCLILDVLEQTHKPLTIEMIFNSLKKHKIDIVTVYRTIDLFVQKSIVRQVDLRQSSLLYELNHTHHHHIVCTHCHDVEDFDTCGMNLLSKQILCTSKKFSHVQDHTFELFGVCHKCTKKHA